ncbi:MAG: division/cell wall cluster transcriptional repressor MraZ [Prolixibacteraceae bacterium]|nr:division/cell wall cluster transcriptional repressor MraZ [Prolixibacteraceae bacterium]MDI9563877.1 division/cell wall cluster transcriptional repressor MraZ [Bacteroidota bacterium]NLS98465.1 division/cell wall cluster transcriptional repressor MraZ [Bacteroidales bacterium]OQB82286.1 MAG: cell division protein MraZ [Bacteroidetes bacterium ADurb.Bin123]HNZ69449.1 division/cell wall cluster transcriptional repressor MraZ [Prolixibacteraceae bacterium]
MNRFSARYNALTDDKGRVVLPAAFKKAMGVLAEEPLVIEKDVYKACLNIYPLKIWEQRLDMIERQLNPFNEDDDDLLADIYENFATVVMAPNGRINIPADFMEYAEIERDVVFVGKGQSITLWDEKKYRKVKEERRPLRDVYRERLSGNSEKRPS